MRYFTNLGWGSLAGLASVASMASSAFASATIEQNDTIPSGSGGALEFIADNKLTPGVYRATFLSKTAPVDLGYLEIPRCNSNQATVIRFTYNETIPSGFGTLDFENHSQYEVHIQNPSHSSRRSLESRSDQNAITAYCGTESTHSSVESSSLTSISMPSQTSSPVNSVSMADVPTTRSTAPDDPPEPKSPPDSSLTIDLSTAITTVASSEALSRSASDASSVVSAQAMTALSKSSPSTTVPLGPGSQCTCTCVC